jgi:hypothetical protein
LRSTFTSSFRTCALIAPPAAMRFCEISALRPVCWA